MKTISTSHFEINPIGALTELSLSGKVLAAEMGVSENTVSNWKKNGFPKPAIAWLKLQIEANTKLTVQKQRHDAHIEREQSKVISEKDYINSVESTASYIWELGVERYEDDNDSKPESADDVREIISDYGIDHEQVDSDEWMIYTRFHAAICQHSNNAEAYQDVGVELTGDYVSITQQVAFWAMMADVQEKLSAMEL